VGLALEAGFDVDDDDGDGAAILGLSTEEQSLVMLC